MARISLFRMSKYKHHNCLQKKCLLLISKPLESPQSEKKYDETNPCWQWQSMWRQIVIKLYFYPISFYCFSIYCYSLLLFPHSSSHPKKCPYFMLALYLLPLDLFQQMPSNPQKELKSSHLYVKKIKINLNDLSSYYLFILSCSTFYFCFSVFVSRSTKEKINFFYIFLCGVTFAMETSLTNWFMDG